MDVLSTLGSNLKSDLLAQVGIYEHAVIEFPHLENKTKISTEEATTFSSAFSKLGDVKLVGSALQAALNTNIGAHLLNESLDGKMVVQFNPANIRIRAFNGGQIGKYQYGDKSSGQTDLNNKRRIDIGMTLYFDATVNAEAFDVDKTNIDVASAVKTGLNAAATLMGRENTVKNQVEAFHAAARYQTTDMIFTWKELSLCGRLTTVYSQYTMFYPNGNPARAKVDINLTVKDDVCREWAEKYKKQLTAIMALNDGIVRA